MKVLFFDCKNGLSGDMLLGALVDAVVPFDELRSRLAGLARLLDGGFELTKREVHRSSLRACKIDVVVTRDSHEARTLDDVEQLLGHAQLPEGARALAIEVFTRLAHAEAKAHGCTPQDIHFHEVGAVDSLVDIAGAAVCLDYIRPERVLASSVGVGSGFVSTSHGQLPVPVPAVVELLRGVPVVSREVDCEITTPTGAAFVTTVAEAYVRFPDMTIAHVGCGAGRRDLTGHPNVLRVFFGNLREEASSGARPDDAEIWVVETNLDDVSPEIIGYAFDRLFDAGALEVFSTPVHMKRNRPGVVLTALCAETARAAVEETLFRETSTFGLRRYRVERSVLARHTRQVATPYGEVRVKVGGCGADVCSVSPEYEDCRRVAEAGGVPLKEVYRAALEAAAQSRLEASED